MVAEVSWMRQRKSSGFMNQLSSAFCEWFLIFLLFIDAALSYFLTKFANYCELKTPCLLCSRPDHILGKKKSERYWSLLCNNHREEISSQVSCSIHGKFADAHGMCEECLTSIALQNKSNDDSHRLLVGKLWVDVEKTVLQNMLLNKTIKLGSSIRRTCTCCNKTWRNKSNADRLVELPGVSLGASKANVKPPLPRVPGRSRFSRRDSLKRLRDKFTGSSTSNNADKLSHVGYTKLKISSDTESEFLLSEDDDEGNFSSRSRNYDATSGSEGPFRRRRARSVDSVMVSKHQLQEIREVKKPVSMDEPNLLDLSEQNSVGSSSLDAFMDHGLRELNWEESYNKRSTSLTQELISLDDGSKQDENGGGSSVEMISKANASLPHMSAISVLSELLSLYNDPSFSLPNKNVPGTSEKPTSVPKDVEAASEISSHVPCPVEPKDTNLTDASSQNIEHTVSDGNVIESENARNSTKTEDNIKPVPQVSDSEPRLLTSKETNPGAQEKHEESKNDEDTRAQEVSSSSPMKRNDSSYESLDGMSVTDVEGESLVERLRRQVEHDRSTMTSLYKELEEERNAAAIAANQAMAMITRLQEEKAALHMEALQYLRMMEEQAEYDMEALERANDLLGEKEKELQDLETELEFYRNNLVPESGVKDTQKEVLVVEDHVEKASSDSNPGKISKGNGECKTIDNSVSNFEDEKNYISQCLKKLEKKLHQSSSSGRLHDMPNGVHLEKKKDSVRDSEDSSPNKETVSNKENGDNKLNGSAAHDTESNGISAHDSKTDSLYEKKDKVSENGGETNLSVFEKGMAELQARLETLEIERDVLMHAANLLSNGKDGLHYFQDIAHHLQSLREIEFERR